MSKDQLKRIARQAHKRFKSKPDGYYCVADYLADRFAWLGIVLLKENGILKILSVGMEIEKEKIDAWGKGVIANRKKGGMPKNDPPDMTDRRQ